MTIDADQIDDRKSRARSHLSNRPARLAGKGDADGRSRVSRRFRDLVRELLADLGGTPTAAQTAMARRAATLVLGLEQIELRIARGEQFDMGGYSAGVNALRRALTSLKISRLGYVAEPLEAAPGNLEEADE
jgi:hypothetical protein